jgi:hypothetical protein
MAQSFKVPRPLLFRMETRTIAQVTGPRDAHGATRPRSLLRPHCLGDPFDLPLPFLSVQLSLSTTPCMRPQTRCEYQIRQTRAHGQAGTVSHSSLVRSSTNTKLLLRLLLHWRSPCCTPMILSMRTLYSLDEELGRTLKLLTTTLGQSLSFVICPSNDPCIQVTDCVLSESGYFDW